MIRLEKIEAKPYEQRAVSDRKAPTRYAVYDDAVKLGEVGSYSQESWDTTPNGRIRTRMRGYTRTWKVWDASGRVVYRYSSTRERAVAELLRRTGREQ